MLKPTCTQVKHNYAICRLEIIQVAPVHTEHIRIQLEENLCIFTLTVHQHAFQFTFFRKQCIRLLQAFTPRMNACINSNRMLCQKGFYLFSFPFNKTCLRLEKLDFGVFALFGKASIQMKVKLLRTHLKFKASKLKEDACWLYMFADLYKTFFQRPSLQKVVNCALKLWKSPKWNFWFTKLSKLLSFYFLCNW